MTLKTTRKRGKFARLGSEAKVAQALEALVDRVDLRDDGFRLRVQLPIESAEKLNGEAPTHLAITRMIPMQMRRRGVEMKFIITGDPKASPRSDPALLKLIARARCWFDDLVSGRAASMVEIGNREKVGKRYVSRIVRFAFLAPAIVEQLIAGSHPPDFTAERLLRSRQHLPLAWVSQRKLLGFPVSP